MAASAGAAVANLYYPQPLLPEIASTWHVSAGAIGSVMTFGQVGYALGMLLIVPLGDALERRRLIVIMLALTAVWLAAAALSPGVLWLAGASLAIGFTTITPQLLVPFAASLAPAQERGRVVGDVMSGLLIGILLARTVSGAVGEWLGWRTTYVFASVLMLGLAAVLRRMLPPGEAMSPRMKYGELLASLAHLVRDEPALRSSSLLGACSFACFSAFWTVLPFLLTAPPFRYSAGVIGLFGLIGLTGVTVAPLAGRLSDSGRGPIAMGAGLGAMLLSLAIMYAPVLPVLIAGTVLLDLGSTANHISNQLRVYAIRPEARNRINTVYMVRYFAGGSLGSQGGAWAWTHGGWTGFCAVGGLFVSTGVWVFLTSGAGRLFAAK